LCLNQVGQDQLAARPTIIPEIIGVLTSERHLKVLHEKENAVLIGTAIDELIRHHPSLKTPVFDSLVSTLNTIEDLGNTYKAPEHLRHLYHLVPVPASASDDDVTMQDGEPDRAENTTVDNEHNDAASEDTEKPNIVVSFMDVTCRV
jgi:E3 ubiquitin-protein ligase HUWE1